MLKQRVITAVVLLIVLVSAVLAPDRLVFELVILAFIAAAFWEWLRLAYPHNDPRGFSAIAATIGFAAAAFSFWWVYKAQPTALMWLCVAAVVSWCLFGLTRLGMGLPSFEQTLPNLLIHSTGVINLIACYVAVEHVQSRWGAWVLLSLMAIVWVADIAGYFVGRTLGKHKLAPNISPNKTIEGAAGAVVFVAALSALVALMLPGATFQSLLTQRFGLFGMISICLGLTILSISGDLFESMLKRRAGVKDSSSLLPGHGGVLDRVDALIPVLPAGALLLLV